jgi:hypothetical protein
MLLLMYPFWFAQSLIGIGSPTARRPRAYYFGIGIDFTSIYIFGCAACPGHAMPRGGFLHRFSVIQSAHLHCWFIIATIDRGTP